MQKKRKVIIAGAVGAVLIVLVISGAVLTGIGRPWTVVTKDPSEKELAEEEKLQESDEVKGEQPGFRTGSEEISEITAHAEPQQSNEIQQSGGIQQNSKPQQSNEAQQSSKPQQSNEAQQSSKPQQSNETQQSSEPEQNNKPEASGGQDGSEGTSAQPSMEPSVPEGDGNKDAADNDASFGKGNSYSPGGNGTNPGGSGENAGDDTGTDGSSGNDNAEQPQPAVPIPSGEAGWSGDY